MTSKTRSTVTGKPLGKAQLRDIDAWWRAANYLSVGQIYLMDNPLLREPLLPEHVKPRLLGHWGTTPGLNFVYAHLNRAIVQRDLDDDVRHRPRARRSRAGRVGLAGAAPTARSTRTSSYDEEGMRRLFTQFSFPGGIPQPRRTGDARVDPRGRRARLLPVARVRRRLRQPGPRGGRGRRRRRGRDRSAGDELALEQVRRPAPRRRGAADPAPQRLQDRQPDGARAHRRGRAARRCCAATATRRTSWPGDDPDAMHQAFAATLDHCLDEIRDIQEEARTARQAAGRAAAVADDRAALPQGLDRPEGARRPDASRATGGRTRCRSPTPAATTRTARCSSSGCAATAPRSSSTTTGRPVAAHRRPAPRAVSGG